MKPGNESSKRIILNCFRLLAGLGVIFTGLHTLSASETNHTLGSESDLSGVAYGNGIYAAVGASGAVLVSADTEIWSTVESGTDLALKAITFAEGTFVAVGEAGTILISETGLDWSVCASGTTETLLDVAYGDGRFVAVGEAGVVLESNTAIDWEASLSGTTKAIVSIAYGAGKFVAVAVDSIYDTLTATLEKDVEILVSADATATWEVTADLEQSAEAVVYAAGEFYLYGRTVIEGTVESSLRISADATTWVHGEADQQLGAMMAAANAQVEAHLETATQVSVTGFAVLEGASDKIVAVGSKIAARSMDVAGSVWSEVASAVSAEINAGVHGAAGFVIVGDHGLILCSDDAVTWRQAAAKAVYAEGKFIGVSSEGEIVASLNGVEWNLLEADVSADFTTVEHCNGKFIAVSEKGDVMVSADGDSWNISVEGSGTALLTVAFENGNYIAAGANGTVLTSLDAHVWTEHDVEADGDLVDVYYENGDFGFISENGSTVYLKNKLFLNATAQSDGSYESVWMGRLFDVGSGFYYQTEHAWLFAIGENERSIFAFHYKLNNWIWTSAEIYPLMFCYAPDKGWLYYVEGTGDLYFSFSLEAYVQLSD